VLRGLAGSPSEPLNVQSKALTHAGVHRARLTSEKPVQPNAWLVAWLCTIRSMHLRDTHDISTLANLLLAPHVDKGNPSAWCVCVCVCVCGILLLTPREKQVPEMMILILCVCVCMCVSRCCS
jgi:hypothetical protein